MGTGIGFLVEREKPVEIEFALGFDWDLLNLDAFDSANGVMGHHDEAG